MPANATKLLCYGIGNKSRGDDGIGPALLDWLESVAEQFPAYDLTLEPAFQLQPENIYDFASQHGILFIDADISLDTGFCFKEINAQEDSNPFVSHALAPEHLLHIHNKLLNHPHPKAFLLSVSAQELGLHEELSITAKKNLSQTKSFLQKILAQPLEQWQNA